MHAQRKPTVEHGPRPNCLPPLFTADEWRAIVAHLRMSTRQAQIVDLILRGQRDKEIVAALRLKAPTLTTHLRKVFHRLGVRHRMELAHRVFSVYRELHEIPKNNC